MNNCFPCTKYIEVIKIKKERSKIAALKRMSSLIKTYLNEDVRLFEINEEDQSLAGLKRQICGIYGQECDLDLKFIDEDGDMITLSSDEELKTAMRTCEGKSLKLNVFPLELSPLLQPMGLFDTTSSDSEDEEFDEEDMEYVDNACEDEEEAEMKREKDGESRVCFQIAAHRLQTFHNLNVSGEQLQFIFDALKIRPRRFVKSGLLKKGELALESFPTQELESISHKPTKRMLKQVNPKASTLLKDALSRYGACDVDASDLSKVLLVLGVRPKRFVKFGLMSKEELRMMKDMSRFGFEDGPAWKKRGCGRRGRRGRRGHRGRGCGRRCGGRGRGRGRRMHQHPPPHFAHNNNEMHFQDYHHQPYHEEEEMSFHPPHGPYHDHQHHHFEHQQHHHGFEHHGPHHFQHEHHHRHHQRGNPMKGRSGKALCRFVGHVSHPDHSEIPSSTEFMKVWRVRNDGEVSWPSSVCVTPSGRGCEDFGAVESVEIEGGCSVGEEREVSFPLIAPSLPGLYECMFRLSDQETGKKFGQTLWVRVMVLEVAREVPSEEGFVCVNEK